VLVAIIAASLLNELQAAKQRVPISIGGTVLTSTSKTKVTSSYFLSSPSNRLVLAIDLVAQTVDLEEWSSNLTVQVDRQFDLGGTNAIFGSIRMGYTTNATGTRAVLESDLEQVDIDWNDDDVADSDGNLQLTGKLTLSAGAITKLSGTLHGVLNDQVNGATGTVNTLLQKGKIKATGPAF
jgi:hypothetical protein